MKECEKVLSRIHLLAEGELGPDVAKEMSGHINDCSRCSAELEKLKQFKTVVEGSLSEKLIASDVSDVDFGQCPAPSTARRRLRFALKWASVSVASAAAIIAVVAVGYLHKLGFIGPKPVAARQLHVSNAGGKWTPAEKKIRGMTTISTREKERRSIRLESGVMVVLNEKTSLKVKSASLLSLKKGDIYVDTAGRKGLMLRITTAHANTIVTGTKLGVSTEDEQTSVVVEEGKVTVGGDWGEQVVVCGSIFYIIESMKPEPPHPADVEEIFFWVRERAQVAGMMLDLYEDQQQEPTSIADDEELLGRILYGLGQSRDAIWSGDVIFDLARFSYGHEITEEERNQYIEHVIEGHISQLDSQATPAEEDFKKTVLRVLSSSAPQSGTHANESSVRWIFDGRDRVRKERVLEGTTYENLTEFVMNGDLRYFPGRRVAERSADGFPQEYWWNPLFPAYFGRCPVPISDLLSPRLLRTEEINGIESYLLEADLPSRTRIDGGSYLSAIQLWVEPGRGCLVHKAIEYTDVFDEYSVGQGTEFIAESFVEVSPDVYFPQTVTRNIYMTHVYSGKRYLQKEWANVYTLHEGEFNESIPADTFDLNIPPDVEITEYMSHMTALRQPESAATEEYLEQIYDELEQIRLYDDPSAPGSRKFVLRTDREKLGTTLRGGGVIWAPAQHNRNVVGVYISRIDPAIAAEVPFLPGDTIYTLNDEPWKVRGMADWMNGMESSTTRLNSGLPITAGVRRSGELIYVILWLD